MQLKVYLQNIMKVSAKSLPYCLLHINQFRNSSDRSDRNSTQAFLEKTERTHKPWQVDQARHAIRITEQLPHLIQE